MKPSDIRHLVIAIIIPQAAGLIGTVFTTPAIPTWYAALTKPALNPPSWVFGPVWTTLFVLMGIASFLVWRHGWDNKKVKVALSLFGVQLVLNTLWSIIFFGAQNPGLAFAGLVVLWLAIAATIITFARVSKAAAWLLVPYICWVTFAGYLNFAIWQLN